MASLSSLLESGRAVHTIGFDDGPFKLGQVEPVPLLGVVCQRTRFIGMLCDRITLDGTDATEVIARVLTGSKFGRQVHLVLFDGLTMAGFNFIDLPALADAVGLPCVAVMRREPDLEAMARAFSRIEAPGDRWEAVERAGEIHHLGRFWFQVAGERPQVVARALDAVTDRGHVPEPLRLAHLIGGALVLGTSGNRA